MPITVQHQPSLAKLGQLAYRTGQLQYSDRRRQEEEARLMKERQMATQQQQFGQKMAFDVWNRQFGQAGAMQQLMVQNQIQGQRDQRQQQFMMNRIDVGHQNNLALDDIDNMQQMDRDNRLQEWRGKEQKLLQEQQLAKEIRAQDAAADTNRDNYQFKLDSAGHQNAIKNLSGAGQEAYIAEMRTGTELQNQQSEMAPDEYEQQQTAHQERLSAVSANHEYQLKMMKAVPNHPFWYQNRLENGEWGEPTLNLEEKYPELKDYEARHSQWLKDSELDANATTGKVWLPDISAGPGGGSWVTPVDPTAVKSAEFTNRTKPMTMMLDSSRKHLGDLLKQQLAAITDPEKAAFDDSIEAARDSVTEWDARLKDTFNEMYPGSAESQPPPELGPPPEVADLRGQGEGGIIGAGPRGEGLAEEILGPSDPDLPAAWGRQPAGGGAVGPPKPTNPQAPRGSADNRIEVHDPDMTDTMYNGTEIVVPLYDDNGKITAWQNATVTGGRERRWFGGEEGEKGFPMHGAPGSIRPGAAPTSVPGGPVAPKGRVPMTDKEHTAWMQQVADDMRDMPAGEQLKFWEETVRREQVRTGNIPLDIKKGERKEEEAWHGSPERVAQEQKQLRASIRTQPALRKRAGDLVERLKPLSNPVEWRERGTLLKELQEVVREMGLEQYKPDILRVTELALSKKNERSFEKWIQSLEGFFQLNR